MDFEVEVCGLLFYCEVDEDLGIIIDYEPLNDNIRLCESHFSDKFIGKVQKAAEGWLETYYAEKHEDMLVTYWEDLNRDAFL